MDRRVSEGIEACRPASDDIGQADLAHVAVALKQDAAARVQYDRVQKWDARVTEAMEHVELPAGLADRILERLQAANAAGAPSPREAIVAEALSVDTKSEVAPSVSVELAPVVESPRWRGGRRRWLATATSVAALLVLGLFVERWISTPTTSLETLADRWLDQIAARPTDWKNVDTAPPAFPLPDVVTASPVAWQRIGPLTNSGCIAYKLTHRTAGNGILFVARMSADNLATAPPPPQSTGGGKTIGYWRNGPLVYVLVVSGNERDYRAFLSTARIPLA